jgi:preprotein translocase subunit SecA
MSATPPTPAMPASVPGGAVSELTRYEVMFQALRARQRRPEHYTGLDTFAVKARARVDRLRTTRGQLLAEAARIDALRPGVADLTEAQLDEAVRTAREAFVRGRADVDQLRGAMALMREVARRQTGQEPYLVQLAGALGLYHGRVVEMATGEGKTLTGSIAAPLIAWKRKRLHVLTVNDYLAARDAESRRPIYERCGLTVGAITQEMSPADRARVYARHIVYGTPKQITADWLRDQLRIGRLKTPWTGRQTLARFGDRPEAAAFSPLVPGLHAALVDEADAVLIDEGVVPLIIAQARKEDEMGAVYATAARLANRLDEGPDYTVEHVRRRAELKRRGRERLKDLFAKEEDAIWRAPRRAEELIRQALAARHCYLRGHHYQIVDGRVVIVDEYTGRYLADRSWEHGLHQAVEAKENVEVTADRETLARVSFQRFFRSYRFLAGMSGTAIDARGEIEAVYARPVVVMPTNMPLIRERWPTRIFRSASAKFAAIVDSVVAQHAQGRPVLVGTRSIEVSERISERLEARGLAHQVLNANFDKTEADLIAQAGRAGAITVATNMAGRGTDILLDDAARGAGGLHVVLTEPHASTRIDRQFIGRAGRQGDPGSAQVFVSLEDELIVHNAAQLAAFIRRRTAREEVSGDRLARIAVRRAQRRAEHRDRINRGHVLRQDDWIEKHLPGG